MDSKSATAASDQEVSRKLKEAENAAKQAMDVDVSVQSPKKPPEIALEAGEKSVAGRKKMKGGEKWDVSTGKESTVVEKQQETPKTEEEKDVELEFNTILKRSFSMPSHNPTRKRIKLLLTKDIVVIIFSKSYCPHSKKAKAIFEKYTIVPAPFVVELDQHPLGAQLQASLAKSTGRRTVPNILINGKSIGGGDDIEALHKSGELIDKVKSMGGKRVIEAQLKDA